MTSFGEHHHHSDNPTPQKLEEFLSRLEEEHVKIDAFKRELPLCMQLLTNAMEASRQQLESLRATHGARRPFLEEFIPLRNSISDGTDQTEANSASGDKANWMTTAQLWSQGNNNNNSNNNNNDNDDLNNSNNSETEIGFHVTSPGNNKLPPNGAGGGFLQFSRSPVLALASPDNQELGEEDQKNNLDIANLGRCLNRNAITVEHGKAAAGGGSATVSQSSQDSRTAAAHRKARRCWSPDLHRRFVNALQMLGGSQVATPKQIRELMKVDGLTNDEVKSHLQKYRLHTRRPSPTPQATVASTPQLVVLGGIWVPPEYSTAATTRGDAQAPATLYGTAHPNSQHFSMGHEFFAAPPPPHHLPFHHQQFHLYKTPPSLSRTQHSRESDARRTGDQSESIEIGKSESGSWRADSGVENGGERKGRVLKEDGEVSNGRSDITLKF
ncbi:unnamed protein product [Cuscuta europaea]|uniref:HTH myb-type domain-containing protein n=1 Tax=Cuscuta europaea TaxID=41803 RepID=A0A9P0Z452_CUSEU|nr:unnamed protein product [Cuscuta europaea]